MFSMTYNLAPSTIIFPHFVRTIMSFALYYFYHEVMRFYARDAMPAPIIASLYSWRCPKKIALATWQTK